MNLRSIGKRIREKRESKSWTQEKLAEKAGLNPKYIGMIERGVRFPALITFIRLVNILDTTADELLVDVINRGYTLRMSRYSQQISELDERERERIYEIIEAYLRKCK